MATNVQGSASSIGMAPAAAAQQQAAASGGTGLPSLGGQGDATGATGTTGATGAQDPNAAAATGGAGTDPLAGPVAFLAGKGTWLGPLLTIGGAGLAAHSYAQMKVATAAKNAAIAAAEAGAHAIKVPGRMKLWAGVGTALAGVAITGLGFMNSGIQTGAAARGAQADQEIQALTQTAVSKLTEYQATNQQLLAELQKARAGGGGQQQSTDDGTGQLPTGQTGDPTTSGDATASGNGSDSGQTVEYPEGTNVPVGIEVGDAEVPKNTFPTSTGSTGSTQSTGSANWSIQSVLGKTASLEAGQSARGSIIAQAGDYRILEPAGDPNGYATLDEANAAARSSMSTELDGSSFLRWMVVEHGGRYYGAIARRTAEGEAADPLPSNAGNVVAWSAINHFLDDGKGGDSGWKGYAWTKGAAPQTIDIPYGSAVKFPGGSGTDGATTGGQTTTTTTTGGGGGGTVVQGTGVGNVPAIVDPTTTGGTGSITGGGPVARGTFDPAAAVGSTFAVNASNTAGGVLARGGVLQIQHFVETSTGGFGTAEEAALAARTARAAAGGGDQWARWATLQGADGRFYVYQGSIVARPTADVQNAAPVHVFGNGFAEYFDGPSAAWKAVTDE